MKLESVIKRYPDGESDVIVKCHGIFTLDKMYRTFKTKMYPGGDVTFWEIDEHDIGKIRLVELFQKYLVKRNIKRQDSYNVYSIAQELNLELNERYTFLLANNTERISFLIQQIKYQMEMLLREENSKDVFHLN